MAARSRKFTVGTNGVYTNLDEFMAGQVIFCASAAMPAGYVECNGAALSRATYGTLFAAIGSTYGPGDGATTFNVPDLRGEFVRGADRGRGVDSGRGVGTAQSDGTKAHKHPLISTGAPATGGTAGYPFTTTGAPAGAIETYVQDQTGGLTETRPRNVAMVAAIKYS
jgi:microcystin-dependent protein